MGEHKAYCTALSRAEYMSEEAGGLWVEQSISLVCLSSPDADCTEIKNKFVAARSRLPVMFIATPKDRWGSMWTQERPSAQVSWAFCSCPMITAGLEQFLTPSAGMCFSGSMGEPDPCYVQGC